MDVGAGFAADRTLVVHQHSQSLCDRISSEIILLDKYDEGDLDGQVSSTHRKENDNRSKYP
jgi:hypothetical protein